jgi:hypothetical protein
LAVCSRRAAVVSDCLNDLAAIGSRFAAGAAPFFPASASRLRLLP